MNNYQLLNEQLYHILQRFDLNQTVGGCALVIYHQDKCITDLSYGVAKIDKSTGETTALQTDTLSLNFSTGKGVLSTLIHVLVSQGLLNYDKPIADYWQNFAQNGKQDITLRDVLSHQSGLFNIVEITENAKDMLDWQTMLQKVEQMSAKEKQVAYSALVSGWVLGGLIEQVTAKPLQQVLDDYLLQPMDLLGQVYIGVPAEKVVNVAQIIRKKDEQSKPMLVEDSTNTLNFYQQLPIYQNWQQLFGHKSILTTQDINNLYFSPTKINIDDYKNALVPIGSRQFNYHHAVSLQAKIPAANGVATAQALAKIYAMLANGGEWQGKKIIQPSVFDELKTIQNQQFDKIMPAQMNWRLGYHRVFAVGSETEQAFGHMGYNGSVAWCDPSRQLSLAFVHNYDVTMLGDIRQFIINETVLPFFSKEGFNHEL